MLNARTNNVEKKTVAISVALVAVPDPVVVCVVKKGRSCCRNHYLL